VGIVERIWSRDGALERLARGALTPASWLYGGVASVRNAMYDRGLLPTHASAVPVLSLGNLSVGGTGKTPVAAWAAGQLQARGARPAVVLRGYAGTDELLVHRRLNRGMGVVCNPDRVAGTAEAAHRGADCVVLDDAFQHRRIRRVADWVLVSAEQWREGAARLPAGAMREGEGALARATLLVVTRKTASLERADALASRLGARVPGGACAVMHLAPHELVHAVTGTALPASMVSGRRYLAVAAIGAPGAFFDQLRALGAAIEEAPYRDHHRFTEGEVRALQRRAAGTDGVICTLKDAVKLGPDWRGAETPLWYVSQAAVVDRGAHHLEASLAAVLSARPHSI
jgi:tetraacyldisaccharide 4'-kinase